ncbi:MAG: ribonuclease HII [Acidimicrobiaceae bacterium]|nr:ribonuclease HII [Acidimicrobiaceae bacterium]
MASTAPTAAPLRRALRGRAPGLRAERALWDSGAGVVAGVDEVGRGSWAGPLTVAAVVADPDRRIYKVRDSKMLTAAERETLHDRIRAWAQAVSVGHATVTECTELGMADAQRLAAWRAIDGLGLEVDHVLVDGKWDFLASPGDSDEDDTERDGRPGVTTIVRGDASSLSIASASVVAKVTRDRLMVAAAERYPAYWFASNKGYPCPRHIAALAAWGPCAIHRRRWVFMDDLRWSGVPRVLPEPQDAHPQLFDTTPVHAAATGGRR